MLNRRENEKKDLQKRNINLRENYLSFFWQESYLEKETFICESEEKKSYEI